MRLFEILRNVLNHPLNRQTRILALKRFLRWQIGSRLIPFPIVYPFVGKTVLVAERGMTGATGNIYNGLEEFENMGFLLHFLRPGDRFLDVGANIGSYSILAAGVIGCKTICLEPVPATFSWLQRNIKVNNLESLIEARQMAASDHSGSLAIHTSLGAMNHVVSAAEGSAAPDTTMTSAGTVDEVTKGEPPALIKIDVEGFEQSVLSGSVRTLQHKDQQALLIELGGLSNRFGVSAADIRRYVESYGYTEVTYDPWTRTLTPGRATEYNALFIKDLVSVAKRVSTANGFSVNGQII